ncbi:MAG: cob(I)yrinic acid a,c-diamide adenosyltransferase [Candidatus Polarisedimenticolaceae bacterium]|nr:cob(I)yrinic acid a,c-diamide adenosyltransferase [Candidatus Polarisedimenticolaceae bacterium]
MNDSADERHKNRMAHKKSVIDQHIEQADQEKGLLLVLTGNGKGKSSSGFGMIVRAMGHGLRCGVVQFIKAADKTGEELFFRHFPQVEYYVEGEGFTWDTQDKTKDIAAAERGWAKAAGLLQNPEISLVMLDELNTILKLGYLDPQIVFDALNNRPAMQHVIITGRGAPEALIELADTVTEMREVKHAYQAGIQAQKGIEL